MNEIEQFLTATIQTLINQTARKQFMLGLTVRATLYEGDDITETQPRDIHVLVSAETNYIGIWVAILKEFKTNHQLTNEDWVFQSYHDSCWRTDGMHWLFNTLMEVREELVVKLKAKNKTVSTEKLNSCVKCSPNIQFYTPVNFKKKRVETPTFRGYVVEDFKLDR